MRRTGSVRCADAERYSPIRGDGLAKLDHTKKDRRSMRCGEPARRDVLTRGWYSLPICGDGLTKPDRTKKGQALNAMRPSFFAQETPRRREPTGRV